MINSAFERIMGIALTVVCLSGVFSCSKWTEPCHIEYGEGIAGPSGKYLSALRDYRNTEHPVAIASLPLRTGQPSTSNHHLLALPDSLDYICLTGMAEPHAVIADEMKRIRKERGTLVLYDIDYREIGRQWKAYVKEEGIEDEDREYIHFMKMFCRRCFDNVDIYGFDGIMVSCFPDGYEGDRTDGFVELMLHWKRNYPDAAFLFRGKPMMIADVTEPANAKTVLEKFDYVIIDAEEQTKRKGLTVS